MLFFIGLQIKYEILIYESSVYLFFWKSNFKIFSIIIVKY
jgi:hypothetical protein